MTRGLRSFAPALLLACAPVVAGPPGSSGVGHFMFAGPVAGASDLSVKWRYVFQWAVDTSSVTEVGLSCGSIDGTGFVVPADRVHPNPDGISTWDGPEVRLTQDSVPWLFDAATTSEICEAVVSRQGVRDVVERIPVTLTSAVKSELVEKLQMSTEFHGKPRP